MKAQDLYNPLLKGLRGVKAEYFVFSKAKRPTPTHLSSRAVTNAWAASLCQHVFCTQSEWRSGQECCGPHSRHVTASLHVTGIRLPSCPTVWGGKDRPWNNFASHRQQLHQLLLKCSDYSVNSVPSFLRKKHSCLVSHKWGRLEGARRVYCKADIDVNLFCRNSTAATSGPNRLR